MTKPHVPFPPRLAVPSNTPERASNTEVKFVFLPQALDALREEFGSALEDLVLPGGWNAYPAAGDLFADDRLSRRMFVVVNRLFTWDAKSESYQLQLLLDIAPNTDLPRQFAIVPGESN